VSGSASGGAERRLMLPPRQQGGYDGIAGQDHGGIVLQDKKLDVFISYSRVDASAFVDELAAGLEIAGFKPLVDRHAISAAEIWKARISSLIQQCGAAIVVITPGAVKSDILKWEVEQAIGQSKKTIPVEWLPTPVADLPAQLAERNIVFFSSGTSFTTGLKALIGALEDDLDWIREHARLGQWADEWANELHRDRYALLLGKQIADAEAWLAARPANAPAPSPLQLEFISASRLAATERDSAERKRLAEIEIVQKDRAQALARLSRRTGYGLIGLAVLAIITGTLALVAFQQNQAVQSANLRLRAGIKLKIAKTDHAVYTTDKWYRVATDYKLSTGIISRKGSDAFIDQQGTGFLMRGKSLNRAWGDELVLLTARHVIGSFDAADAAFASDVHPEDFSVAFPALENIDPVAFKEVAFASKELNVAVVRLAAPPPNDAIPIDLIMTAPPAKPDGGVAVLHWTANEGFSLGLGHLIPVPKDTTSGVGSPVGQYFFTHVTGPGAAGAPVFDTDTGELLCLHQSGLTQGARPWGQCRSIAKLIEAIAADKQAAK
jgi:TIR domain/Trypsin-like peptidase domain